MKNMTQAAADEKILSYNDVVLRGSDLHILSGTHFLNDRIIEFYFSYLASSHSSEEILLVPPSIAFWIKMCPDTGSLKDFLEPLNLSQKKLVLFPINDSDDVDIAEAGSHWSLLAFERRANVFVHHDSSGCINRLHAKRVYKAVLPFTSSGAKFLECSDTPKQVNGYDCGLYVTATARAICHWYAKGECRNMDDLWFSDLKEQITPSVVSEMRREILGLIKSLMVKR